MEQIKLSDFKVIPITSSSRRADISDEVYFGPKYAKYISNSKISGICPSQGGSMSKYYSPSEHLDTSSLTLGTAVHCCTLQPEDFTLAPKIDKPSGKLGKSCECYIKYIKQGLSKEESARRACLDTNYYVNRIEAHIPDVIEKGDILAENTKDFDDSIITLDNRSWETATKCISHLKSDYSIQNKLRPTDNWGDSIPSFNEDTLFLDFIVTYQNKYCTILHIKGKLDNWTIDEDNKILTLNDLKTTGHQIKWFTHHQYGSLYKYHYLRQLKLYQIMLESFCAEHYGYNKNQWKFETNILAVETIGECGTKCIHIDSKQLREGEQELIECLKMIGYYEIFGHENEVEFV